MELLQPCSMWGHMVAGTAAEEVLGGRKGVQRSLPCLALPCLALPCLALPCLALPCLALFTGCWPGAAGSRGPDMDG